MMIYLSVDDFHLSGTIEITPKTVWKHTIQCHFCRIMNNFSVSSFQNGQQKRQDGIQNFSKLNLDRVLLPETEEAETDQSIDATRVRNQWILKKSRWVRFESMGLMDRSGLERTGADRMEIYFIYYFYIKRTIVIIIAIMGVQSTWILGATIYYTLCTAFWCEAGGAVGVILTLLNYIFMCVCVWNYA